MSFFIAILALVLINFATMWGLKKTFPKFSSRHQKAIKYFFIVQTILLIVIVCGYVLKRQIRDYRLFAIYYYLFGLILALYTPKLLFVISVFLDTLISRIRHRRSKQHNLRASRHIIAKCGLTVGIALMCFIIWGIVVSRYNFAVEVVEVRVPNLPPAYDGLKIIQLSDIHAGSFAGSTKRFRKAVTLINEQDPDIIVFTGDMVNNFAEEAKPLVPIFSDLKAHYGKYAVLGNHDYGGYYDWKSPEDQTQNIQDLKWNIASMGFELLNNSAVTLSKDSLNSIAIIGIENWGIAERHPKEGDYEQAGKSVQHIPFKILLSHDPSFWEEKITGKTDVMLTLSGHTHGMQMGVRIGRSRYSPARLQYRHWAGLYHENNQYLYVNRGLGVIGFPGRLGMSPEITLIRLRKSN